MKFFKLTVASEEQNLALRDGYSADIRFDPIYKRWYYNLYRYGEPLYMGVALNVDSAPLVYFEPHSLALIDTYGTKDFYEPYDELGKRLALIEVTE